MLPSAPYDPPVLRGIKFDTTDPLKFDFIVYEGQNHLSKAAFKEESAKLIRFFLAGLTIPEDDLWVNLSPYEHEKIAPQEFSQTDIGKEMLAQDYLLKQLAASLTYPETEQGKKYWDAINNVGANNHSPVHKISKRRYFSGGVVDGVVDGKPASQYIAETARSVGSASALEQREIAADTDVVTVQLMGADVSPAPAPKNLPIVENGFLYRDRLNALLNQVAAQIVDRDGRPIIEKVFVTGSVLSLDKDGKVPLDAIGDIDIVVIENQGFVTKEDAQRVRLKWHVLAKKLKDNGFAQEVTPTLLKITEEVNWFTLPRLHDVLKYSTRAFPLVERSISNPSRRKVGKRFDAALKNALREQAANTVLSGKAITTKVFSSVDIYKKSLFLWLDDRLASSGEILTLEERGMLQGIRQSRAI